MAVSIPPPTSSLAAPGATIAGKYRIDSLIGYGGMGSVWAATHLSLGHQIAIKVIAQAHAQTPDVRRRFDTEAKAVARLRSRHVVQVYDNGELADGTPYIAMELLHGQSLHRRIHVGGPMQVNEAAAVLTQACRALTKAHAAGIVHRDIKPDNIFMAQSEDDGGTVTKVLDFGVAKLAIQEGEQSSTQTGSVVGTPLYMSPEQARGLKTVDHRTDLYSMALVVYTMLTGNLAFSAESFGDLLLKICTQTLPSLKEGAPWLPPEVDVWFRRAAAREPNDRFQSAQEMAEAFAIAAGVSVTAGTQGSVPDGQIRVLPAKPALGDSITKQYERPGQTPIASAGTMTGATVQASGPPPGLRKKSKAPMIAVAAAGSLTALVLLGGVMMVMRHGSSATPSAGGATPVVTAAPVTADVPPTPTPPATPTSTPPPPPTPTATPTPTKPAAAHPPASPPPAHPKPAPDKPKSGNVDLGY